MSDSSLARCSAVMALGTIASRLLGFVRASMLAAVIGIGLAADTFDVANTLPNIVLPAAGRWRAQRRARPADHPGGHAPRRRPASTSTAC